jgi:dTMP kinase
VLSWATYISEFFCAIYAKIKSCIVSSQSQQHGLRNSAFFVSVDGPSGVGKTTISNLLAERLQAHSPVLLTATPSDSQMGELARKSTFELRGKILSCLVAADRYHHQEHIIVPALAKGMMVICDRYVPSSFVLDYFDGVDRNFVRNLYQGIKLPDLAVILVGDPSLCAERVLARNRISRFYPVDIEASIRETKEFENAAELLKTMGYPIYLQDVKAQTPDQVAKYLEVLITERLRDRYENRPSLPRSV